MLDQQDFAVANLGRCMINSPLSISHSKTQENNSFIKDESKVIFQIILGMSDMEMPELFFERAGPRQFIYFDPRKIKAAIVTCGGLSPGLNNVIRSIFLELHYRYKVAEIYGIRYGYKGLDPSSGFFPILLTSKNIDGIQNYGGTFLGTSRGMVDINKMVDTLDGMGIDILFCVGGDGTLKGAHAIWEEINRRKLKISIIGVPKTIDNDISFVYKTFGFDTAVSMAKEVLKCAHVEAICVPNGIGLVKVMGRESGFIAAYATLASLEVNYCLIPEVPFRLDGDSGLLNSLRKRLLQRSHAVIVIAEGAGQDIMQSNVQGYDASGNRLLTDIGEFLKNEIKAYFEKSNVGINLKYIDPSYMIRSIPANTADSIFCENLARNAVHAGMSGKTDILIGLWHGSYTHVPLKIAIKERKKVNQNSSLWRSVLGATGQPDFL